MPMTSRGFGHSFCTYSGEMYFRNISSRVVDLLSMTITAMYYNVAMQWVDDLIYGVGVVCLCQGVVYAMIT